MKSHTVEAVVLKHTNFGEADRLLTLFTKSLGKVTVLAKGVRKLSSKRAGSLELFNLTKVSLIEGRGHILTLAEVQLLNPFPGWRKHLGRITIAYELCETVDKLLPDNQPNPDLFDLLIAAFSQIGKLGTNWREIKDNWLLEIVRELGFWPHNKRFTNNIEEFIETISERPIHSSKLLSKLK